jgi:signal transduction histidine kinase
MRARADAATAQFQALQALTDTALSHLALEDLLRELLGRVTTVMGVDHGAILLPNADGQQLRVRAARGLLESAACQVQIPLGHGVAGRTVLCRAPLIVDDLARTDLEGLHPLLRERLRSFVSVPLLVVEPMADHVGDHPDSRLVGVLQVGCVVPRHFLPADVQLLQHAADRIALAIDRAHVYAAEQDARYQAEAALDWAQASEAQATTRAERLNTILETIVDGVGVVDIEGHLLMANRAYRELFALEHAPAGYEALPGRERFRLVQVRDAATGAPLAFEESALGRAVRGEVVRGPGADIRVRAFDGRELEINHSSAPLRDQNGQIAGAVGVLHDMTEHHQLAREREAARADELAAREISRRLEEFVATAAHDLRSPLAATAGFLGLAQRQLRRLTATAAAESPVLVPQVAAAQSRLEEADKSTARLTRLLGVLFDTSAMRAGRLELDRAPHDLVALVQEEVAALRVSAPERTIHLRLPARGAPIPVDVDGGRIGQVVTNYVSNALKYSKADQPVDVAVTTRGGRARVLVRDRGPGLPPAERARVWKLFHRVAGVSAQGGAQGGSLGLGLYISKAIVEAHSGRVGVASTIGQGSIFWMSLPLASPSPEK